MLKVDEIKAALPEHLRNAVTQDIADLVNTISSDPETSAAIRETFIGHTTILKEGRFKLEDYVRAAAYVSYKLMGYNNQESFVRTFPHRYKALVARGTSSKDISSHVAMYNKNKLVNRLTEQAMIPIWILNQDAIQMAIATQVELMNTSKSEMVRTQAANSILTHLRPPEKKQVDLSVSTPENSGMPELRETLERLAIRQRQLIDVGTPTREIANQSLRNLDAALA